MSRADLQIPFREKALQWGAARHAEPVEFGFRGAASPGNSQPCRRHHTCGVTESTTPGCVALTCAHRSVVAPQPRGQAYELFSGLPVPLVGPPFQLECVQFLLTGATPRIASLCGETRWLASNEAQETTAQETATPYDDARSLLERTPQSSVYVDLGTLRNGRQQARGGMLVGRARTPEARGSTSRLVQPVPQPVVGPTEPVRKQCRPLAARSAEHSPDGSWLPLDGRGPPFSHRNRSTKFVGTDDPFSVAQGVDDLDDLDAL